jgi:hypothetical protein
VARVGGHERAEQGQAPGSPASELRASLEKDKLERSQLDAKNDVAAAGEGGTPLGVGLPASAPTPAEQAPQVFYEMSDRGEAPADQASAAAAQVPAGQELLGERLRQIDAMEGQDEAKKAEILALAKEAEQLNFGLDREANVALTSKAASELPSGSTAPSKEQQDGSALSPPWAGAGGGGGGTAALKPIENSEGHYGTGTPSKFAGAWLVAGAKNGEAAPEAPPEIQDRTQKQRTDVIGTPVTELIEPSAVTSADDGETARLLAQLGYAGLAKSGSESWSGPREAPRDVAQIGYTDSSRDDKDDRFRRTGDWDQSFLASRLRVSSRPRARGADRPAHRLLPPPAQERPARHVLPLWGDNPSSRGSIDPLSTFSATSTRRATRSRALPREASCPRRRRSAPRSSSTTSRATCRRRRRRPSASRPSSRRACSATRPTLDAARRAARPRVSKDERTRSR